MWSIDKIIPPDGACAIIEKLNEHGYEAYIVGGCVRDSIMKLTPHDWDICTSAKPEQMLKVFADTKVIETGLKHGTITVVLGDGSYEVTTFRRDGEYSDGRHPDSVQFVTSVAEDLARRDFTMNAMAYSLDFGLIDYFDGEHDVMHETISCVGSPDERFSEDSLRILRALRFASTYGFSISPATAESIHRNAYRLNNIAAERINVELCKLLCGKGALQVLLDYSDVLAVIIPELSPCIGFEQNNKFHQYTIYEHMARAAASCQTDDVVTRVALLLHDIGKPQCYTEDHNGGHFYGHAVPSRDLAERALDRLRFDNKRKKEILDLILYHDSTLEPTPKVARKWLNKLGPEQCERLLDIKCADARAHAAGTQDERLSKYEVLRQLMAEAIETQACFSMKDLAINGNDVMSLGVFQGKIVGKVLNELLAEVINGILPNDRSILMEKARLLIMQDV